VEPRLDDGAARGEEGGGISFEEAYRGLEEAVAELEKGDLSLDDSLAVYERGTALAERCTALLTAAELRIRRLDSEGNDEGPLEV
jgi:exodeoxyribonuclease VII small subunit